MLHPLIIIIFQLLIISNTRASSNCPVGSFEKNISNKKVINDDISSFEAQSCKTQTFIKDIEELQKNSLQKMNAVLKNKEFKQFITELKDKEPTVPQLRTGKDSPIFDASPCYVFVSFSIGERALLNLAQEAKRWGATLVLRGFKEGSYKKTALALQKIIEKTGQGFIIDPELFSLFAVQSVPTIILSKAFPLLSTERVQTPLHDRLQGHVSVQYALERFSKEGDLKEEARVFLKGKSL